MKILKFQNIVVRPIYKQQVPDFVLATIQSLPRLIILYLFIIIRFLTLIETFNWNILKVFPQGANKGSKKSNFSIISPAHYYFFTRTATFSYIFYYNNPYWFIFGPGHSSLMMFMTKWSFLMKFFQLRQFQDPDSVDNIR